MDDAFIPLKKRRLQNACDECRKRKIKCDSANMPGNVCSNCLAFRTQCAHVMASVKKRRGPPRGTPRGTKTIRSIAKSILSSTKPFVVPEDPEAVRQLLVDLAHRILHLEEQLDTIGRRAVPTTSIPSASHPTMSSIQDACYTNMSMAPHDSVDPDVPQATNNEFVAQVKLDHSQARHFGQSSSLELIMKAMSLKRQTLGKDDGCVVRRPQFWRVHPWQVPEPQQIYTFPERDLTDLLVDLYFTYINLFYPVLHRGVFERALNDGLQERDPHFGSLLLAVCAVGAKICRDPRVLEDPNSPELSSGWKWFRQIRFMKSDFRTPPSIYELQMYSVAIYFMAGTSTPEASWVLLGLGLRYAQDLGIHRKPPPGHRPTVESQLWNRAFWSFVAIDVVICAFQGRPRATHTDDFDLPLPIECDDEYWETEDSEQAFKQPGGKPSTASYWVLFLKLMDILGFAQRTLYAVRKSDIWARMGMTGPEWNEKIVRELDTALNTWIDAIPDHLRWDPNKSDPIFFHQSTILYVTYYWIQILVHKPFISPTLERPMLSFPSSSICVNAARSCIHLVDVDQRRSFFPTFPTVMNGTCFSSIILFLNAWRGQKMNNALDIFIELRDVYKVLDILRKQEWRIQASGRFRQDIPLFACSKKLIFALSSDILNELLSMYNMPQSPSTSFKRSQLEISTDDPTESTSSHLDNVAFPRPIAGSKRVSASSVDFGDPSSSGTRPPGSGFEFTLPIHSADLGSLPLNENYVFPPYSATPPSSWNTSSDVSQTLPSRLDGRPYATTSSVRDSEYNLSSLQDSVYMNRYMAESLTTAFGTNSGNGTIPYTSNAYGTDNQVPTNAGASSSATAGSWVDWGSYMADLDQLLQNFPSQST